jgi:hypothetical protein
MYGKLEYDTSIEHGIMETLRNAKKISRGSKLYGLYMLNGSTVFCIASKTRQNMLDNYEICGFYLLPVGDMGLVGLDEQGFLGDRTELKML